VKSLKIFVQRDFSRGMEAGGRRFSSVLSQISCHVFLFLEEERCTNVILLLRTVSMRGSGEVERFEKYDRYEEYDRKKREYETSDERYED